MYSGLFQPVTMFSPHRPPEISSIVATMRAAMIGCVARVVTDG